MEINDFLGIAIVGVIMSLLIEGIKQKLGDNTFPSRVVIVAAAIVVGGLYVWIRQTIWWSTILGVLAAASTFYGFFIAKKPSEA